MADARAHAAVAKAVANGLLSPMTERTCEDCGESANGYHHESYEPEDWLDVVPLCDRCHGMRHRHLPVHHREGYGSLYVRGLSEQITREIKSQAALRGQTIAQYLTELVSERQR